MTVKEHYDQHLGNFYSWMTGDFEVKQREFQQFLIDNNVLPASSKIAIDLGAGHGIQSVALAHTGFTVKAIDFNKQLLDELRNNSKGSAIDIIEDDIRNIKEYAGLEPELIICWGDTITHLDSKQEVEKFITDNCDTLIKGGKFMVSFRDYSNELTGDNRFIPVKSDADKILTCFLEYGKEYIRVTDLLYSKTETGWEQKVSSYNKVRILPGEMVRLLQLNGMNILYDQPMNRMTTIIAVKK
jgi:2-polyprenyl-3-methyl-5-hydroxy-6-metoxy-1,4-benzoquinol methylase